MTVVLCARRTQFSNCVHTSQAVQKTLLVLSCLTIQLKCICIACRTYSVYYTRIVLYIYIRYGGDRIVAAYDDLNAIITTTYDRNERRSYQTFLQQLIQNLYETKMVDDDKSYDVEYLI